MKAPRLTFCLLCLGLPFPGHGESQIPESPTPARLALTNEPARSLDHQQFQVPLPAHAQPPRDSGNRAFQVESSRQLSLSRTPQATGTTAYFLRDIETKEDITPESANLNLPSDTTLVAKDTGETILLPAGTYRQIMQFPINSPEIIENTQTREAKSLPMKTATTKSRYATPSMDPIWVRYESLEKIRIGDTERRGGLDIPSHGSVNLGPRVWYAKSETADWASSFFYFVFGGLGYGVANTAGWAAGNTREVSNNFEYRLVRR